jgi:hypothetical protein
MHQFLPLVHDKQQCCKVKLTFYPPYRHCYHLILSYGSSVSLEEAGQARGVLNALLENQPRILRPVFVKLLLILVFNLYRFSFLFLMFHNAIKHYLLVAIILFLLHVPNL